MRKEGLLLLHHFVTKVTKQPCQTPQKFEKPKEHYIRKTSNTIGDLYALKSNIDKKWLRDWNICFFNVCFILGQFQQLHWNWQHQKQYSPSLLHHNFKKQKSLFVFFYFRWTILDAGASGVLQYKGRERLIDLEKVLPSALLDIHLQQLSTKKGVGFTTGKLGK